MRRIVKVGFSHETKKYFNEDFPQNKKARLAIPGLFD